MDPSHFGSSFSPLSPLSLLSLSSLSSLFLSSLSPSLFVLLCFSLAWSLSVKCWPRLKRVSQTDQWRSVPSRWKDTRMDTKRGWREEVEKQKRRGGEAEEKKWRSRREEVEKDWEILSVTRHCVWSQSDASLLSFALLFVCHSWHHHSMSRKDWMISVLHDLF